MESHHTRRSKITEWLSRNSNCNLFWSNLLQNSCLMLFSELFMALSCNDDKSCSGSESCNCKWQSQVTSTSIYSPYISRRKYRLFLPKKALLYRHSIQEFMNECRQGSTAYAWEFFQAWCGGVIGCGVCVRKIYKYRNILGRKIDPFSQKFSCLSALRRRKL